MQLGHVTAVRVVPLAVLALVWALLGPVGPALAGAEAFTVTKTADTAGTCTASDCSLREAVLAANAAPGASSITVPAGTYRLTIGGTGENHAATGDLDLTADVTIVGAGAGATVIDANGIDRAVDVHSGIAVELQDLTVTGGATTSEGGGIRTRGADLSLHGVTVTGNTTGWYGAGVFVENGSLTLAGSSVVNNRATDCCGGGIAALGGTLTIADSTISRNTADGCCGGGIFASDVTIDVTGSAIDANRAPGCCGGGIFTEWSSTSSDPPAVRDRQRLTVTDTTLNDNRATSCCGGAIFAVADNPQNANARLTITGSELNANDARDCCGGAVFTVDVDTTITGSELNDNVATWCCGGAVFNVDAPLRVIDSQLEGNRVDGSCCGGAIWNEGEYTVANRRADLRIERSKVTDNVSSDCCGGGIFQSGGDFDLVDSTVDGNSDESCCGGGIFHRTGSLRIEGSTISHNALGTDFTNDDGGGAGLWAVPELAGTSVTIRNSTFSGNSVRNQGTERGAYGGGIQLLMDPGTSATITNSTIAGNVATDAGGGLHVQHAASSEVTAAAPSSMDGTGAQLAVALDRAGVTRSLTSPALGGAGVSGPSVRGSLASEQPPTVTVTNTLLAGNTGGNCAGDLPVSGGHNLDDDGTCGFGAEGDLVADALLSGLGDHGGRTLTHRPAAGSPALEAARKGACPARDQRGVARPQGEGCDIGALESGADLAVTVSGDPKPVQRGETLTSTVTVTNAGSATARAATLEHVVEPAATVRSVIAPPGAACVTSGSEVSCDLGDLAPGAEVTVAVRIRPDTRGTISTRASATSATFEEDASTTTASVTTQVDGAMGVERLRGADRIATAIAVSDSTFAPGGAPAVVLSRADDFPDALAGTPLAIRLGGPLLLSYPDALDARTESELRRVLPTGSTVVLLGGPAALSEGIEQRVRALGYETVRYQGRNRYETAIDIAARGLENPDTLFMATGLDFADALAGGAAAGDVDAAVLLTAGDELYPGTAAYLATRPEAERFALGGPASRADPGATAIRGATRFETSVLVAEQFFDTPGVAGVATAFRFPDALTGGVQSGRQGGPVLLTDGAALHPAARTYLASKDATIELARLYGGLAALGTEVEDAVSAAIR